MDQYLDQFIEDHINGGYGYILDELSAEECAESEPFCPNCDDEGCDHCSMPADTPLDGDHETGLRDAGWGTDEDYGGYGEDFGDW